ncbi:MAG: AAA family ATPase [Blautia faecis]
MIFYGNPGTGKTTCGEIMAQLLLENGVSNGVFVSCLAKLL